MDGLLHGGPPKRVFELLGVEIVTEGCRAILTVSGKGHRTAANYNTLGQCWSGEAAEVSVSLKVDGTVQQTWSWASEEPPPALIQSCATQDEPIMNYPLDWGLPISEMYGNLGNFVWSASHGCASPVGVVFTDEIVQLLAYRIHVENAKEVVAGAPIWECLTYWTTNDLDRATLDALLPLTPYLIEVLKQPTYEYGPDVRDALENITGQSFETSQEWWAWWAEQQ